MEGFQQLYKLLGTKAKDRQSFERDIIRHVINLVLQHLVLMQLVLLLFCSCFLQTKLCMYGWMDEWMDVRTYVCMDVMFLQLVRDLHLKGYEEEVDSFCATQIVDTVI